MEAWWEETGKSEKGPGGRAVCAELAGARLELRSDGVGGGGAAAHGRLASVNPPSICAGRACENPVGGLARDVLRRRLSPPE